MNKSLNFFKKINNILPNPTFCTISKELHHALYTSLGAFLHSLLSLNPGLGMWVTFNIITLVWFSFSGLPLTQPARMPPWWPFYRRWVSVTSRSIRGCWGSITTVCLMWSMSWCSWPTANGTSQDIRKHRGNLSEV